jgi:hypothetical protein
MSSGGEARRDKVEVGKEDLSCLHHVFSKRWNGILLGDQLLK